MNAVTPPPPPPMSLLAELTHRCPLQCPYCSNPTQLERREAELATADWCRVLAEAAALGVLHVHFSGGEPMARKELPVLVAHAASLGLYTNLVTSGVLLDSASLAALAQAGLDHVQLSFQDVDPVEAERMGGLPGAQDRKLAAARLLAANGMPLTINFVIHRQNCARVDAMIGLAAGARRAARRDRAHAVSRLGRCPTARRCSPTARSSMRRRRRSRGAAPGSAKR